MRLVLENVSLSGLLLASALLRVLASGGRQAQVDAARSGRRHSFAGGRPRDPRWRPAGALRAADGRRQWRRLASAVGRGAARPRGRQRRADDVVDASRRAPVQPRRAFRHLDTHEGRRVFTSHPGGVQSIVMCRPMYVCLSVCLSVRFYR